tara:strand:- start:286 stop:534 length:249 start_codon:yes stop_codon:yes gene_type:complete
MNQEKMSALKKEYRQLHKQMAELDQEWIRKHEELNNKIIDMDHSIPLRYLEELSDSIPHELGKRTIGFYEVDEVDEDKEAKA